MHEVADSPDWYASQEVEPIDIIEEVVKGLPAPQAYSLGQVLRYCLRAGRKDDVRVELAKANNYAHRLVYGHWRDARVYVEVISVKAPNTMCHTFCRAANRADAVAFLDREGFESNPPHAWRDKTGRMAWIHGGVPDTHEVPNDGWVHVYEG